MCKIGKIKGRDGWYEGRKGKAMLVCVSAAGPKWLPDRKRRRVRISAK